jgi:hypothetical protein
VHAGTPDETAVVPVVPELVALELAPGLAAPELAAAELAPAAGLEELDELAPAAPVEAVDPADVEDEAAQPAARSPALSSGTTSNAFFTTFSSRQQQDAALMSLMTPQHRTRLEQFSRQRMGTVTPGGRRGFARSG